MPGSVVVLQGPPSSLLQRVYLNLISNHETYQLSFGHIRPEITQAVADRQPGETPDNTVVKSLTPNADVSYSSAVDELSEHITDRGAAVVEPCNYIETELTTEAYHTFLSEFREIVAQVDGLGVILAVTPEETPANRWITTDFADYLFTVSYDSSPERAFDSLELNRMRPNQSFKTDSIVFPLNRGEQVDINTEDHYDV